MKESTITAKGQTTIPQAVREALGVAAGDRVRYVVEGDKVRLLKVRSIMELDGLLRDARRAPATLDEMEDGIAAGAADETGLG
ncbi:AbrB/MazE/SpoVT family DNA-binding domain-containing protein [Amaricoccus sp.]|uniref:AbrB/MazE/SpoVT family DNA-binding domain-containing protein n=1 Tax=Amaricoccus sp. TaxID=1872485 RepID=UPI001B48996B|nr:AbrB/MazE/SpoVT family DNA-binding domain-containing protein [Amaricoccus sp.]MBP7001056.1 AbrB/MazE/SpoVT family DNA-binding domain-containing protein [Amaricoccus sp.]